MDYNNDSETETIVKRNYECQGHIFIIWSVVEGGNQEECSFKLHLEGSMEGEKM